MGGALSLFKKLLYFKETRILCMGLDAAGKTTLLYKLKIGEITETIPTIGFSVETLQYKNTQIVSWDVGGRQKIRPLYRHYFQGTTGIIYVVDSNDRERIEDSKIELNKMLSEPELEELPLLIVANKQDLPKSMSISEITEKLDLRHIQKRKWFIQSTCATSGDGIYEGLDWLASAITNKEWKKATGANITS